MALVKKDADALRNQSPVDMDAFLRGHAEKDKSEDQRMDAEKPQNELISKSSSENEEAEFEKWLKPEYEGTDDDPLIHTTIKLPRSLKIEMTDLLAMIMKKTKRKANIQDIARIAIGEYVIREKRRLKQSDPT